MRRRTVVVAGTVLAAAAALSGGIAIAASGGEEKPLSDGTLARASAAALAHTGGGRVLEAEAGDDGAAFEVEVRLADGRVLEVSLDGSFAVTGEEAGDDGAGDGERDGDD